MTPKDYQKEVHSIVQKYYKASALVSQKDIDQMEKKLIDLYKRRSEGKISYEAKGNQLTVIIFDKKERPSKSGAISVFQARMLSN